MPEPAASVLEARAAAVPLKPYEPPVPVYTPKPAPKPAGEVLPPPPIVSLPPGDKQTRWNMLLELVRNDATCKAHVRPGKKVVLGAGSVEAKIMFVGEAPGADEDRLGKPFVGVSGQLMDRMFDAIGMSRERDLYITNILFWRPPGNRTPTLAEQAVCLAFTRRHIELARPKLVVLAGGTSAKAMLDTTEGIMRLRGKWATLKLDDGTEMPAMPTFHPAYLLRTPASKRQSWLDLLAIDKKLGELGVKVSS